jgi:hypothetical protein
MAGTVLMLRPQGHFLSATESAQDRIDPTDVMPHAKALSTEETFPPLCPLI